MTLFGALSRTMLLMRDEVHEDTPDEVLIRALTETRVALVADERNLTTHAAQTAFVTTAMLMARSGHKIYLAAPNVQMIEKQLPLLPGSLIEQLLQFGRDALPGFSFEPGPPEAPVDLAVIFGDSPFNFRAIRTIAINASDWTGLLSTDVAQERWLGESWPLGGMAAAALAATEAFKASVHRLRPYSNNIARLESVFGYISSAKFNLAPAGTSHCSDLGAFDCISGGAIVSASLYALSRIPNVRGQARVFEPDTAALSNLNRYMLLRCSQLNNYKALDLQNIFTGPFRVLGVTKRFDAALAGQYRPLAPSVLIGVDDIPSRWVAQEQAPSWLAVGATTHWSAMASFHSANLGCARCLHNEDDLTDLPIPTVAFVSFWAGLLVASYFLRHLSGAELPTSEQQTYFTSPRPDNVWRSPVPRRYQCPTCTLLHRDQ